MPAAPVLALLSADVPIIALKTYGVDRQWNVSSCPDPFASVFPAWENAWGVGRRSYVDRPSSVIPKAGVMASPRLSFLLSRSAQTPLACRLVPWSGGTTQTRRRRRRSPHLPVDSPQDLRHGGVFYLLPTPSPVYSFVRASLLPRGQSHDSSVCGMVVEVPRIKKTRRTVARDGHLLPAVGHVGGGLHPFRRAHPSEDGGGADRRG